MLRQIRDLQAHLAISDAQLLDVSRWVSGDPELRAIEELVGVDQDELITELLRMWEQQTRQPA